MYQFKSAKSIDLAVDSVWLVRIMDTPALDSRSNRRKSAAAVRVAQETRPPCLGEKMRNIRWPLLLLLALLATACERRASGPGGGTGAPSSSAGGTLRIAMMPKLVGIDYFNACQQGAEEAAKELGDVDLQ